MSEDLEKAAARGARLAQFMRGDFWHQDLGPIVAAIQERAEQQKHWSPGSSIQGVDEIATTLAYFSGISDGVAELVKKINQAIRDGEAAQQKLSEKEKSK